MAYEDIRPLGSVRYGKNSNGRRGRLHLRAGLSLGKQTTPLDEDGFIAVPRSLWTDAFGDTRAHTGYRLLYRFGLIRMLRQDRRRADGTVEDIAELGYAPFEPMRFAVDVDQFDVDALDRVLPALERASETSLDDAWAISRGVQTPIGWATAVTRGAAGPQLAGPGSDPLGAPWTGVSADTAPA